ncbi:hypothetical protein DVH05_014020 [Phytophthora capsici]|nr:hypothetical protein DVH05_014020 [Phytophthora capsici]
MASREAFWLSALYPPTKNSNPRRKAKTYAVQARLRFISRCIELFGYFDFLRRFENTSHDTLMWFGGKAAKYAPGSKTKTSSSPAPEDLATLHKKDRARYDRTIARAYDPLSIDEDGYSSIPELLEQTQALDPSLSEPNRLSDRALARVFLDATQMTVPPNTNWVGNRNTGVWKKPSPTGPLATPPTRSKSRSTPEPTLSQTKKSPTISTSKAPTIPTSKTTTKSRRPRRLPFQTTRHLPPSRQSLSPRRRPPNLPHRRSPLPRPRPNQCPRNLRPRPRSPRKPPRSLPRTYRLLPALRDPSTAPAAFLFHSCFFRFPIFSSSSLH